jgi:hypothetical protein
LNTICVPRGTYPKQGINTMATKRTQKKTQSKEPLGFEVTTVTPPTSSMQEVYAHLITDYGGHLLVAHRLQLNPATVSRRVTGETEVTLEMVEALRYALREKQEQLRPL